MSLGPNLRAILNPDLNMPDFNHTPVISSPWETQARLFMEGLKAQAQDLEASLNADQELKMTCWHGQERFDVLRVSMPSHNVVALNCLDDKGETAQVTGHMHSVTFSFRKVTQKEAVPRRKIGFDMPA